MTTRRLVEVDIAARSTGKVPSWNSVTGVHDYINPASVSGFTVPSWVGAGAITSGVGGITPPLPAGHVAGDDLWLIAETANEAVATPAGWEKVGPVVGFGTAGAAGAVRGTLFYKRDGGSETDPTITDPGDHVVAVCFATRGGLAKFQPFLNVGCRKKATASTTGTARAGATPVDACLVVNIFFDSLDSAAARYSAPVNADLTNLTERIDGGATDGVGGGFCVVTGEKTNAGNFAATSVTETSTVDASITIIILPAGVASRAGFIDVQEFLTPGVSDTWTKPSGARVVDMTGIGGGASGSAGRNAATAAGGGGGGGGMFNRTVAQATELAATMTVAVGAGGAATANTDGAASNGGGHSQVTSGANLVLSANGGGAAGASASGSGGIGGNGGGAGSGTASEAFGSQPAAGGAGGTTAAAGGSNRDQGGGAGSGGGTTQGSTAGGAGYRGGGGGGGGRAAGTAGTGGTGGIGNAAGGASTGASGSDSGLYSLGGGGGAGGIAATGPGGAGGFPGGGGGGGGSQSAAQRGGAGGDGVITITTYC